MENTQAFLHAARKYSNTLSEHVAKVLNITNVHNKGQKLWQNCLPDNAKTYLCRYGVPEQEVFQTPDLFERRNLPQVAQLQNAQGIFEINVVLHCLYYLMAKLERALIYKTHHHPLYRQRLKRQGHSSCTKVITMQ